ncbi:MAG: nitroreductase family protein [Halanaerobiales bacterium]
MLTDESKFQIDALETIKTRRSVRKYKDKKVEKEKIYELIDAARLAPSGKNIQAVEYVIIENEKRREKLANIVSGGDFIADAPLTIAVISKKCEHDIEDGSAATENILLSARAQGLDSCWVAGYKKDYSKGVEKFLELSGDYRLISLLAIGYSEQRPKPPNKRSIEEVIHYEKI